ncbi:peptidase M50 [Rhodopirellula halodulae]|uniref:peptidase M50 n=1 Tax=Rhodopirellula halodulae TaxID=2894198 RepID=UPI001E5D463E|nr:peptidase M50 [Rhodopirellula sp. JC737]MCC9655735.1 peptidase M50 [Rhodopirellula sp. JC737]
MNRDGHAATLTGTPRESTAGSLRRDLRVMPLPDGRGLVVLDDIAGRFARTSRRVWQKLTAAERGERSDVAANSDAMWNEARAAGWLRRSASSSRRVASEARFSLLSFRTPIGSMDPFAKRLAPISGIVFSPMAMMLWCWVIIVSVVFWMVRWQQWVGAVPALQTYLLELKPVAMALTFVFTKAAHELGHAVLCRRLGSRCGVLGIWWLCFMPCPYVDVTDVWRQPTSARRAAVMAAGIWVEWLIAVVALWVWWLAPSHDVKMTAMNVVLVCGVSTILFNANPLMRYDGYFILSDLLDTANLRGEARRAWRLCLMSPMARWWRLGMRTWSMTLYHLSSKIYRVSITLAIAGWLLSWADGWGLWRIMFAGMVIASLGVATRWFGSLRHLLRGTNDWNGIARGRRFCLLALVIAFVVGCLTIPTPRYRHVEGTLRAKETSAVYLPRTGRIESVEIRVGEFVEEGQTLAKVTDLDLERQLAATVGKQRVLQRRVEATRLVSLKTGQSPADWDALETATTSLETTRNELQERRSELIRTSPHAGIVLRPTQVNPTKPAESDWRMSDPFALSPHEGQPADDSRPWCRIARSSALEVVLPIDAEDRQWIGPDAKVCLTLSSMPGEKVETRVRDVSPVQTELVGDKSHMTQSQVGRAPHGEGPQNYEAVCDLSFVNSPGATDRELDRLLRWDGASCQAVLRLPSRPLWKDLKRSLER